MITLDYSREHQSGEGFTEGTHNRLAKFCHRSNGMEFIVFLQRSKLVFSLLGWPQVFLTSGGGEGFGDSSIKFR